MRGRSPKNPIMVSVIPAGARDHPHLGKLENYLKNDRKNSVRASMLYDLWHDPASPAFAGALAYQMRGDKLYRTGVAIGFTPEVTRWHPTTVDALGKLAHLGPLSGETLVGSLMDFAERSEGEWESFNIVQPIHPIEKFIGGEETFRNSIRRLQDMGARVTNKHDPLYAEQLEAKLSRDLVVLSFGPRVSRRILQEFRDAQARKRESTEKAAAAIRPVSPTMDAAWEFEVGFELALPPTTYIKLRREPHR